MPQLSDLRLTGAQVLIEGNLHDTALTLAGGRIADHMNEAVDLADRKPERFALWAGYNSHTPGGSVDHRPRPRRAWMRGTGRGLSCPAGRQQRNRRASAVFRHESFCAKAAEIRQCLAQAFMLPVPPGEAL